MLRDHILLAALKRAKTLDDIHEDNPCIMAFVRAQHHPLAPEIPPMRVQRGIYGPNAEPRLSAIVEAHPELRWDPDQIQALLIRHLCEAHGDHELHDAEIPWQMHWGPAASAWYSLNILTTLRALGDLDVRAEVR